MSEPLAPDQIAVLNAAAKSLQRREHALLEEKYKEYAVMLDRYSRILRMTDPDLAGEVLWDVTTAGVAFNLLACYKSDLRRRHLAPVNEYVALVRLQKRLRQIVTGVEEVDDAQG
ncbi:hypothetical protein [Azospirillum sp. sgz301742]